MLFVHQRTLSLNKFYELKMFKDKIWGYSFNFAISHGVLKYFGYTVTFIIKITIISYMLPYLDLYLRIMLVQFEDNIE